MEKKIRRLLNLLQAEFVLLWLLVILLVAGYESDCLPQGLWAGDARKEYILEVACILLTVAMIPLSLRVFGLSLTRYVKQLPLTEALKSYRRWNEVRLAMLLAPALFDMSVYYLTLNVTGLLCAGMALVASLFCVPGRQRMFSELDL